MSDRKWEYHTDFVKIGLINDAKKADKWQELLEDAGKDGWELVQIMNVENKGSRDGYHFVFKRPA